MSKIEWTEETWNPLTGCTKVSAGCLNCYAETMSRRLKAMNQEKYRNGFELTLHPNTLSIPYKWKKPRTVFVNSMSDLFHKGVPDEFILDVCKVMKENPKHTFQVLTKRAKRLLYFNEKYPDCFSNNVWVGVSVENQRVIDRIDDLTQVNASVRFLSCEPLLSNLEFPDSIFHIDWVIVGGESGSKARPMEKEWVISIRDQCSKFAIPFFFKQWGGTNKKKTGRLLEGKTYDEYPNMVCKKHRLYNKFCGSCEYPNEYEIAGILDQQDQEGYL